MRFHFQDFSNDSLNTIVMSENVLTLIGFLVLLAGASVVYYIFLADHHSHHHNRHHHHQH
ncbi:hypothetical protein [Flavobacterium swingsii]|uniref:hypothetical protein n=1 Tax=Flavobacterium swingsii TaxID=498292 RepID=UPI0011600FB2|nr:hypothetical protein [Flavobacterium swingsii]